MQCLLCRDQTDKMKNSCKYCTNGEASTLLQQSFEACLYFDLPSAAEWLKRKTCTTPGKRSVLLYRSYASNVGKFSSNHHRVHDSELALSSLFAKGHWNMKRWSSAHPKGWSNGCLSRARLTGLRRKYMAARLCWQCDCTQKRNSETINIHAKWKQSIMNFITVLWYTQARLKQGENSYLP